MDGRAEEKHQRNERIFAESKSHTQPVLDGDLF